MMRKCFSSGVGGVCLLDGQVFGLYDLFAASFLRWPLSDAGRSSLALHTNRGVNCVPKAITANCGAS